jgi:hypothetical protein
MNNPEPWWLTMPPAEVAAAILPHFSSSSSQNEQHAIADIVSWWKKGKHRAYVFAGKGQFDDPDSRCVAEAIQVLEHAGLLMRTVAGINNTVRMEVGLTRLGMHALATNTVRQHLRLSDAPPTA